MNDGGTLKFGSGIKQYRPVDRFLSLFCMQLMDTIVRRKSNKLNRLSQTALHKMKYSNLSVFSFYQLDSSSKTEDSCGLVRDQENTSLQHILAIQEFESILSNLTFSNCPDAQGDLTSAEHRWMHFDDFARSFNDKRRVVFTPSQWLCVDESISRLYGQGGNWIEQGLPRYVHLERKPESGCEIQNVACGQSGIMR